jgi:hypothetical protein
MSDPTQPSRQDRPTGRPDEKSAPDPADLGTAYGMDLSMDAPDAGSNPPSADAEDDPLNWIRRWLERHRLR